MDVAVRAWQSMRANGIRADLPATNAMLNALGKNGEATAAAQLLQRMEAEGLHPNAISYNTVIDAHGRAGNLKAATHTLRDMVEDGLRPNERTFSNLISACARMGRVEEAFHFFNALQRRGLQPNAIIYSSLVDACGRAGQIRRAYGVLKRMDSEGHAPNVVTWTALIDACVKLRTSADAMHATRNRGNRGGDQQSATVPPRSLTPVSDTTMQLEQLLGPGDELTASAGDELGNSSNDLDRRDGLRMALLLFQAMLEKGVRPNKVTCTALMDGCLKCGELDIAFELLAYMKHAGLSPSRVTFTSLLNECTRTGRAREASELLRIMTDDDLYDAVVSPASVSLSTAPTGTQSALSYTVLPSHSQVSTPSLGRGSDPKSSLKDVEDAGTPPQQQRVTKLGSLLVELFSEANRMEDAFFVLRQMISEKQVPDEGVLQATFGAVDTARRLDEAVGLLDDLTATGHRVNQVTYAALVGACGRLNTMVKAFELFRRAQTKLLSNGGGALAAAPAAVEHVDAAMEGLYEALMEACRAAGDGAAAIQVFEEMVDAGIRPTIGAYTSMLSAVSKEDAQSSTERSMIGPATDHEDDASAAARARAPFGLGKFLREVGAVKHEPAATTSAVKPPNRVGVQQHLASQSQPRSGLTEFLHDTHGASFQADAQGMGSAEVDCKIRRHSAVSRTPSSHPHTRDLEMGPTSLVPLGEDNLFRAFLIFKEMRASGLEPVRRR